MKVIRQQREIDRARARLYEWGAEQPGAEDALDAVRADLVERTARRLGQPRTAIEAGLAHEPLATATSVFALVGWLVGIGADTGKWKKTPLARYITERGWRETALGKRWLRLLAGADFTYHDIVDVESDEAIRLTRPGGRGKPFVAHEPRLANPTVRGFGLYARVLPMPQGTVLADGIVLLPPSIASALAPGTSPAEVFAAWASVALLEEGYVPRASPEPAGGRAGGAGPRRGPEPGRGPRPDRSAGHGAGSSDGRRGGSRDGSRDARRHVSPDPERDKLLDRIRKLFAMAQETEASPHEAEIALRRCQSLMARYGITEADLETSEFGTRSVGIARTVPMHVKFLGSAVAELHDVIFVTGRGGQAEFRGYALDADVAAMTFDYLLDAVERALSARRRRGDFPPGRSAAYDYRVGFAAEVCQRVDALVAERRRAEAAANPTGTALTVRKREIVDSECGEGLVTKKTYARGAKDAKAAAAGRDDGSRVSLDPQMRADERAGLTDQD